MKALFDMLMDRRRTLAVHNYDGSVDLGPIKSLLSAHGIQLSVTDENVASPPGFCILYDDGGVVATTTLAELEQYTDLESSFGGADGLAVLTTVDPETTVVSEESVSKLVAISRELERVAWRDGGGRLLVGFQELSMFADRARTKRVYDELASAGVDVTVCGYPDTAIEDAPVSVYEDTDKQFVGYWFVLYNGSERNGALVAREVEPDTFTGLWTRHEPLVDQLFTTLGSTHPELV